MNTEKICIASKTIDIAENESYLTLRNMLCYYDQPNLNNVMLPYKGVEESALQMAKTLINQPVQAKYIKTSDGGDFGGHELSIDSDGNAVWGTMSIGTHTNVWIENSDVVTVKGESMNLPCLFAECRIWKRNENVISTIKKLFYSAGGLNTSWEISTNKFEFSHGVKTLIDYEFIGNTCLGSQVTPAYKGTSKTLSVASEEIDAQLMIAQALSLDIKSGDVLTINENNKEESILENTVINTSEVSEEVVDNTVVEDTVAEVTVVEEAPVAEVETDASGVDDDSAECKKKKECSKKDGDPEDEMPEDDDEKKEKSESETSEIAELNKTIAEKDEIILKASSEITELKARIAELSQYKEKFEKAEQEKIEAELAEKKEELISSVVKSGHMTREEIESSEELKGFVEALDKASLMAIIGERLISSIDKVETSTVEVSETNEKVHIATNLNDSDEDVLKDGASVMRKYLGK